MVRGCASRSLVARVATPFKRVRDTVSPAPGLWTEGEMRKGVDRRRRVRAHLERVNLFAAGIDVGSRSHFVAVPEDLDAEPRSEEHTSELQSIMRISYAVCCLKKKKSK